MSKEAAEPRLRGAALVVSAERAFAEAACAVLGAAGLEALAFTQPDGALEALRRAARALAVVHAQGEAPGAAQLVLALRSAQADLPVIVIGAAPAAAEVVAALRAGAADYLERGALASLRESASEHALRPRATGTEGFIAADPRSRALLELARRVASRSATVLLEGESGSGKEALARFIHRASPRAAGPFIGVNCAAIPESLLEATFFGHERGAYTGALQSQAGKFEQAQGGTLLLDEVGDLPLGLQAKLLRVLQERELERVGGHKTIALDVRVLAASNRDLEAAVARGEFREDLYYRLAVFPIEVPALRERPADIVPLALAALERHAGEGRRPRLSAQACERLRAHPWPGNVRELDNAVQRALVLADAELLGPEHFALQARRASPERPAPAAEAAGAAQITDIRSLEREHIIATLEAVNGSRKLAVRRLGISERTLRNKLRQYRQAANH